MSLYGFAVGANTPNTTMKTFGESLCTKHRDDPYECISCEHSCPQGLKAVEKIEKETQKKEYTNRQKGAAQMRLDAMLNYVEAAESEDPIRFIMEKHKTKDEHAAKQKMYLWQYRYGKNIPMVKEKIKDLKNEMASLNTQTNKVSTDPVKAEIAPKTVDPNQGEKKMTKRQEEKISQSRLEQMRLDLEADYLKAESDIENYKKEIQNCEKKMEEITNQINAIRQVLDIFKKKDELFV